MILEDPSSSTTTDLMDAVEEYLEGKEITNKRLRASDAQ